MVGVTALEVKIGEMIDVAVSGLENEMRLRVSKSNKVRKLKRSNSACLYQSVKDGFGVCYCVDPSFRCGERGLPVGEGGVYDRAGLHRCNYSPQDPDKSVLIFHDDELNRKGLTAIFVYLGVKRENIDAVGSLKELDSVLKKAKIDDKQYGLMLVDECKKGEGYGVVNTLVERDYNSRIVFLRANPPLIDKPGHYLGDEFVVPGERAVVRYLVKGHNMLDDVEKVFGEVNSSFTRNLRIVY